MLRYQSLAIESLTELYRLTNERGKLQIRRKWLNLLTPRSLAVWWLDDGSLIGNGKRGVFCTDSFSYEEHKVLAQYLLKVWKIKTAIGTITRIREEKPRVYYRLWVRSSEELKKFLRIILPEIPVPTMLPKTLLLYKDSQLQQRWISEVVESTSFSREVVERYLTEKKEKYRRFRK